MATEAVDDDLIITVYTGVSYRTTGGCHVVAGSMLGTVGPDRQVGIAQRADVVA